MTASGESTASSSWRDDEGAKDPLPVANKVTAAGASGWSPPRRKKLFERIDCSAGDFQYVVVAGTTYLFWIQPGKGDTDWERVNWCNLETTKRGQVTWTGNSANRNNAGKAYQDWFVDYDFTVESSRDSDSTFCALTILSGQFGTPSENEVNPPNAACAASVLMQKQEDGSLAVVYYHETSVIPTTYRTTASGSTIPNYPTMPEVSFNRRNARPVELRVHGQHLCRSDETKISGQVHFYDKDTNKLKNHGLNASHFESNMEIARYHVGEPTAISAGKEDDKMNFYVLGTDGVLARIRRDRRQVQPQSERQELAKGDIVNFKVVTRINRVNDKATLFYLDRVKTDEGGFIHRLKGVTLSPQSPEKPVTVTDYDIEVNADRFDTVKFGGGIYLYWTECSTPKAGSDPDYKYKEEYLVRCVRYDPDTDTICDPFTLVQLGESPSSVKLQDSGAGFYAVDLGNEHGSYLRQSLTYFTYRLVMSAELQAAVPNDPCVCAGDYIDLILSVRNTGNLPLSGLDVKVKKGSQVIQTLHINCAQPQESTNTFSTANGDIPRKGLYTIRRIDGMYDPLNGESWNITSTNSNGVTTQRNVRTTLLMPGDTQSYKAKLLIPADWDGKVDLTAEIIQTVGAKQFGALLTENGRPLSNTLVLTTDAANDKLVLMRLTSEKAHKIVDTNSHDLMLSAQLFNREGETYVRVSILNRSGNTGSAWCPPLTSSYNGQTLFSHTFRNAMEDDYGYSMDIPLKR